MIRECTFYVHSFLYNGRGICIMMCLVVARDRNVKLDSKYTIKDAIEQVDMLGNKMNLKGTLRYYGLSYVEDRSFFSKYKDCFHMKDMRSLYNITLGELLEYKNKLIYSE